MKRSETEEEPGGGIRRLLALAIVLSLCLIAQTSFAETTGEKTRTYALIVANNTSVDPGVEPLRFADDDGARYFELFDSLVHDARLLTTLDADSQKVFPHVVEHTEPPTRARLARAVGELSETISENRKNGIESEVYLVFTGHGNVDSDGEGYLSLGDGKLNRRELFRDVIGGLGADYTHLLIDACHSFFMVESRGGDGQWRDDRSGDTLDGELGAYLSKRGRQKLGRASTVGVIVSTSGTSEVHEWSRYRAGVFSHQLRSALLGAADVDGDGQITYAEIEAYLVAANAGVSNPRARINVYASPPEQNRARPLARLDDYRDASVLAVSPQEAGPGAGRFHLEDARGLRYADFHVDQSLSTRVVMLHKPVDGRGYYLRTNDEQANVPLDDAVVDSSQLAFAARQDQARGAVDEAFRTGLFSVPYGHGFYSGFVAGRDKYDAGDPASMGQFGEGDWRVELGASYALSAAMLDADGLQHSADLSGVFRHRSGWGVGPFLGYGFSPRSIVADSAAHRGALGVELSRRVELGSSIYLLPSLRTGYQLLVLSGADADHGDPLGARGEARLGVGWDVNQSLHTRLTLGASADVVTQTSPEQTSEQLYWHPFAAVGVGF